MKLPKKLIVKKENSLEKEKMLNKNFMKKEKEY